ncbi:MAG: hypothetical protein V2A34_02240 [Lentisphaerota bacterium]
MYPSIQETLQGHFAVGLCVHIEPAESGTKLEVEWTGPDGEPHREMASCLNTARVAVGDQVLLAPVGVEPEWVVLGALGCPQPTVLPASGFRLEGKVVEGEDRLSLRNTDGQVELEIRIVDGRTHLVCPTRDAVLACEGNFEVRAGDSIKLKAGGKLDVEAASQHLRSREGEIRVQAKKNLVLWGEFLLLNTKEEQPWTSKT